MPATQRGLTFAAALHLVKADNSQYRPRNFVGLLSDSEIADLQKTQKRIQGKKFLTTGQYQQGLFRIKREFVRAAVSRKTYRTHLAPWLGRACESFEAISSTYMNWDTLQAAIRGQQEAYYQIRQDLGRYWHDREQDVIKVRMPKHGRYIKPEGSEKDELPLYACSGELEANRMKAAKIIKLSKGHATMNGRSHAKWRQSSGLVFSQDGGGQAETQFLITPERTRLVCGLVLELGPQRCNGGHIHLNCKGDEAIGERVFNAFRYHISWTRWLVGSVRRRHRWSPVLPYQNDSRFESGIQRTFEEAKRVKRAAVSANTWSRTGTIEMRIWGTTSNPAEWLGRRDLMIAIARWSETHAADCLEPDCTTKRICNSTGAEAWPFFFRWAATHAPKGLAYALKTLRRKARSSRRNIDSDQARQLMGQFEASGLTCAGYRRRNRITTMSAN